MTSSLRATVALSVLGLSLAFTASCRGPKIPQPPQVVTAGLRIDVVNVTSDARRQRVVVRARLWNDHEGLLKFDHNNVRLLYNGREVAAKGSWRSGRTQVRAKSNDDFDWSFELGEAPVTGNYQIEIRDLMLQDAMLGETAAFAINV